jgi:Zn-dependent protease with chaperone function
MMDSNPNPDPVPETDLAAQHRAHERKEMLAAGMLALPNLFLRSVCTLAVLYGILGVVLITIVQFQLVSATVAVIVGCALIVLQFLLGPFVMDLMLRLVYRMRWVQPDDLPEHLEQFVARVCNDHGMRFPSFGIIDDGAPQAFTYGHHPSNARVVISKGTIRLLEPEELEAVVAHELGHARNWDMALMTLANLVPLLLFWIYDLSIRFSGRNNRNGAYTWVVAIGAYVLYVISEYIVLWFSRTREYYADRFAGRVTGNPNALASALVKIAYGLAAQDSREHEAEAGKGKKEEKSTAYKAAGAIGALNIFDRKSAITAVMNASATGEVRPGEVNPERVKSAMQWDLWNPWASWYELNSTHPLIAKRLLHLSDQASSQGGEPYIMFDRAKPESYWDDFFVDLCVLALPWLGLLTGIACFVGLGLGSGTWYPWLIGVAIALLGAGAFIKNWFRYRGQIFEHRTVATLMGQVKVSPVRPIPCTLQGTIIGKGVPGLIWSEDFVIQDPTGILFLDYRQPLAIWDWLFGLLRAGRYQGKEVRVTGWFRRAPMPYLEIYRLEVVDGSQPTRRCYTYWMTMIGWAAVGFVGAGIAAALFALSL